jgi:molybdate transport system substrate-binding protein
MKNISRWHFYGTARAAALVLVFEMLAFAATAPVDLTVVTSGAFTAAYKELAPQYEAATGNKLVSEFGASMGTTHNAIPMRLERGEAIDVVIMAAPTLDELIKQGKIQAGSHVDLVQSKIGMAVKDGTQMPDISTVEKLKDTLLAAKSIAYSDSASGVYLSTELFPRLGIADQIKGKATKINGDPVGAAVAKGEVELGFQQVSELRAVDGIQIAELPADAQRVTIFAAGIPVSSTHPEAARAFIQWLTSPAAYSAITKSGLEPMHAN